MKSYSQAKQDLFVLEVLKNKRNGSFLDIGCSHPINISNTFLLESEFDWRGISIDIDNTFSQEWKQRKKSKFINEDALSLNYKNILKEITSNNNIDYLSLDLEPASVTFECLKILPFDDYIFSVITYEHDSYRFGDIYQKQSTEFLTNLGYVLIEKDVTNEGYKFEDWYVHNSLISI